MDKFYKLSDDTIDDFNKVIIKKAFPVNLDILFIGSSSQKGLIKVSKVPENYEFILEKNILVTINEELFDAYDEICREILFEQEIDKITINVESGKIKFIKPDLNTFSGIVKKYGVQEVSRANQVDLLATEQKEDKESELI